MRNLAIWVISFASRPGAAVLPVSLGRRRWRRTGLGRVELVPAQPGLWLPGFGGYGPPGPARGPAVADVVRDGVKTEAGGDPRGALTGRVALGCVDGPGEPVPAQRGLDGMVGQAGLGGDGVDRAVLDDVPLVQVAGHVGEAEL